MTGESLPDAHHVARFCDRKFCAEDGTVAAGAFMLRAGEPYISVQWLERLARPDRAGEIEEVREVFSKHLKIRRSTQIAVLNAGVTRSHVALESGFQIDMRHQPEAGDEAHSGIFGTEQDGELIAELILETIQEIHPARHDG